MKQKIFINGRFIGRRITGVERFAHEVVGSICDYLLVSDKCVCDFEFILVVPKGTNIPDGAFPGITILSGGLFSGHLWEQFSLPFMTMSGALISLCNTSTVFKRDQIVVIHDAATAAAKGAYSIGFRTWYNLLLPFLGRISRFVVTVSEFSRGELVKWFGIDPNKIVVVGESGRHFDRVERDDRVISSYGINADKYILAVSSLNPNKNFRIIIELIEKYRSSLKCKFVVAGGVNDRVFGQGDSESGECSDKLIYVGYVSEGELKSLYSNATCFLYPSTYEGYGLPPLEAMSVGCPVVVSNAASLPEVCGDSAFYFNPSNVVELAEKVVLLINNESVRNAMSEKAVQHSKVLLWSDTSRIICELVRKVSTK